MATEHIRGWREQLLRSLRTALRLERVQQTEINENISILRLHIHQHRIIVEMFRATLAGFVLLGLTSLGFTVYAMQAAHLSIWVFLCLLLVSMIIFYGLWLTWREFCRYRQHYQEVHRLLQSQLEEQTLRMQKRLEDSKPFERLLLALHPTPHRGWDAKDCARCGRSMELLSKVCVYCHKKQPRPLPS